MITFGSRKKSLDTPLGLGLRLAGVSLYLYLPFDLRGSVSFEYIDPKPQAAELAKPLQRLIV